MTVTPGTHRGRSPLRRAFAGWIHYRVFNLFIGAWEVCDALRLVLRLEVSLEE